MVLTGNSDGDVFQTLVQQQVQNPVKAQQIKQLPKTVTVIDEEKGRYF